MTADMINAEEALRIGLVQKMVEPNSFIEEVMKIARIFSQKDPMPLRR